MPLPDYPPVRVQAPKRAGVGLRFPPREAQPGWPPDWWQRNYDEPPDDPGDPPLTEREMHLPPPP
jgi:hypothetical protein